MRIKIKDIPDGGQDIDLPYGRPLLEDVLAGQQADVDASRARAQLHLDKLGDNVFARGAVDGEVVVPCARCLKPATVPIHTDVRMTFTPEDELPPDDSVTEDVEFATHNREVIDLDPILRESVILGIPMTPLCREDCLGLCTVCGKDRNLVRCTCDPHVPDPRFAALKNLKV